MGRPALIGDREAPDELGRLYAGYFALSVSLFVVSPESFFFDFFLLFFSPLEPPDPSPAWAIVHEVGSSTASVKNRARINFMAISFVGCDEAVRLDAPANMGHRRSMS
jgi:hypothetical protein